MSQHLFDQAVALQPEGEGRYCGATHPAWANMIGPFGGITGATILQGMLRDPRLLGAPIALTVNYAAATADGPFVLSLQPARTNRSTQHWNAAITQTGADGREQTVVTATAVTAARRETWGAQDAQAPASPAPDALERFRGPGVEWLKRYDMRPVHGPLPAVWDGSGEHSLSRLWMRDDPPRPLDLPALAALADVFYPRVWLRRATRVPAGSVSITTYFHADDAMLARTGSGYLLGQAQAHGMRNGFFDQSAQLWNQAGELLATSHQIVYYKE